MGNILKFEEYTKNETIALDFIRHMNSDLIIESKGNKYELKEIKSVLKKIGKDLDINIGFMFKFGTGIVLMSPIVESLIKNMKLNIECTTENIILLTVTCLAIVFLDGKLPTDESSEEIKKDTRSLLEELKLKGISNVIVKKMLSCFDAIYKIFKKIWDKKLKVVNSLLDLFTYTTLFLPTINAISYFINKHSLDIDNMSGNFLSLGVGLATITAKNALNEIIHKIKNRFGEKAPKELIEPKTTTEIINEEY